MTLVYVTFLYLWTIVQFNLSAVVKCSGISTATEDAGRLWGDGMAKDLSQSETEYLFSFIVIKTLHLLLVVFSIAVISPLPSI